MKTMPRPLPAASQTPPHVYLSHRLHVSVIESREELLVHGLVETAKLAFIRIRFHDRVVLELQYTFCGANAGTRFPFAGTLRRPYRAPDREFRADWEFEVIAKTLEGQTCSSWFVATPSSDGRAAIVSTGLSRNLALTDATPSVLLHVERASHSNNRTLTVTGWVASLTTINAVEIFIDGSAPHLATTGLPRPDVAAWRPEYPNAQKAGFEVTAALTLPSDAVELSVRVITDAVVYRATDSAANVLSDEPRNPPLLHCERAYLFFDGLVFASGWAAGDHSVASVSAAMDGQLIGDAELGTERNDVAAAHPGLVGARHSGFRIILKLASPPSAPEYRLTLTAITSAGGRSEITRVVKVSDRSALLRSLTHAEAIEIGAVSVSADCLREPTAPSAVHFAWAPERQTLARDMVAGRIAGAHPLQKIAAKIQLAAWHGHAEEAIETGRRTLGQHAAAYLSNDAAFMDMLFAQFATRRFDLVASMLEARYRPACSVVVSAEDNKLGSAVIECAFDLPRSIRFTFDVSVFADERSFARVFQLAWVFPQLAMYTLKWRGKNGRVLLNQWDCGVRPGLAYCDNRDDYFLVPDPQFVSTEGYSASRRIAREAERPWQQRKPVALWRGATTGLPMPHDSGWRGLQRIALCRLVGHRDDLFDVGISEVVQLADMAAQSVKASGLMRPYVPFGEFFGYKYQIDIDGNTNSWPGLFHKLLTGSPVLKIASPNGYRQWYYDRLKPWENFVPVASDMSDLVEMVTWLHAHDDVACRIGRNGRDLANAMDLQAELQYGVGVIDAALAHFNKS